MKLNKTFVVYAEMSDSTVEHEEYEIQIPAASDDMAELAGKALCESLGLKFMTVFEKDWK
jgi:hypothetical protein